MDVAVEFGELVDEIPYAEVRCMEYVGTVIVNHDAIPVTMVMAHPPYVVRGFD